MKHYISLLTSIALAICGPNTLAAKVIDTRTGQTMPDKTSTAALCSMEATSGGIIVTYTFPYVAVDSVMHNGEWNYVLSFENFPESSVPGKPIVPMKYDAFEVPSGEISFTYIGEYAKHTLNLLGAPMPVFEGHSNALDIPPFDYSGFYPSQNIELENVQSHRDKQITHTLVSPIKYNPQNDAVEIAYMLSYEIRFSGSLKKNKQIISPILKSSILQDDDDGAENHEVPNYGYLIITTSDFSKSVAYFADWKKAMGFDVHVCQGNWTSYARLTHLK